MGSLTSLSISILLLVLTHASHISTLAQETLTAPQSNYHRKHSQKYSAPSVGSHELQPVLKPPPPFVEPPFLKPPTETPFSSPFVFRNPPSFAKPPFTKPLPFTKPTFPKPSPFAEKPFSSPFVLVKPPPFAEPPFSKPPHFTEPSFPKSHPFAKAPFSLPYVFRKPPPLVEPPFIKPPYFIEPTFPKPSPFTETPYPSPFVFSKPPPFVEPSVTKLPPFVKPPFQTPFLFGKPPPFAEMPLARPPLFSNPPFRQPFEFSKPPMSGQPPAMLQKSPLINIDLPFSSMSPIPPKSLGNREPVIFSKPPSPPLTKSLPRIGSQRPYSMVRPLPTPHIMTKSSPNSKTQTTLPKKFPFSKTSIFNAPVLPPKPSSVIQVEKPTMSLSSTQIMPRIGCMDFGRRRKYDAT